MILSSIFSQNPYLPVYDSCVELESIIFDTDNDEDEVCQPNLGAGPGLEMGA